MQAPEHETDIFKKVLYNILTLDIQSDTGQTYITPLATSYTTINDFYTSILPIFIEEIKANLVAIYNSEEYYCTEPVEIILDPTGNSTSNKKIVVRQADKSSYISAHYQILYNKIKMDDTLIVVYFPVYSKAKEEFTKQPFIGIKTAKEKDGSGVIYFINSKLKNLLNNQKTVVQSKYLTTLTSFRRQLVALLHTVRKPNLIVERLILNGNDNYTNVHSIKVDDGFLDEFQLNDGQRTAVKTVLSSRSVVDLIQGPPGTGKSHTLITILKILLKRLDSDPETKILICTPSNNVLDHIIDRVASEIPIYNYFDYKENFRHIEMGREPVKMLRLGTLKDSESPTALNINIERLINMYGKNAGLLGGSAKIQTKIDQMMSQMHHVYTKLANIAISDSKAKTLDDISMINRLKTIKFKLEKLSKTKIELESDILAHQNNLRKLKQLESQLRSEISIVKPVVQYEFDDDILKLFRGTKVDLTAKTQDPNKIKKLKHKSIQDQIKIIEDTKNINVFASRQNFIKESKVIFSTLNSTGANEFYNQQLDVAYCIVDESTQSTMVELLVALKHVTGKLILIGDHKQLPATTYHPKSKEWKYNRSFFDVLVQRGYKVNMLNQQFRMVPNLSKFPSKNFYDNKLVNAERVKTLAYIPSICKRFLTIYMNSNALSFLDVNGTTQYNNKSYYNMQEVRVVCYLVKQIPRELSVGVITPYSQQVLKIKEKLDKVFGHRKIEVNSIDGFQGKEKDVIIISCVKSMKNDKVVGLGFLEDERRLNVAITRARYALITVGNSKTLSANSFWSAFITHTQLRGNYMFLDFLPDSPLTFENIDALIRTKIEVDLAKEEDRNEGDEPDRSLIEVLKAMPKHLPRLDIEQVWDFTWHANYNYQRYFADTRSEKGSTG